MFVKRSEYDALVAENREYEKLRQELMRAYERIDKLCDENALLKRKIEDAFYRVNNATSEAESSLNKLKDVQAQYLSLAASVRQNGGVPRGG